MVLESEKCLKKEKRIAHGEASKALITSLDGSSLAKSGPFNPVPARDRLPEVTWVAG
jgi:hypothetical protein